jgi:hypothetical protein
MKPPKLPPGPSVPELIITISANGGRCPGCRRALFDDTSTAALEEGKVRITTVQWFLPFEHDPEDCTTEVSTVSEKAPSVKAIRAGLILCDELQAEIAKTRERLDLEEPSNRRRDAFAEMEDYAKRAELLNGTHKSLLAHELHYRLGIHGLAAATSRRVKDVNDWLDAVQKDRARTIARTEKMQRALDKHRAREAAAKEVLP